MNTPEEGFAAPKRGFEIEFDVKVVQKKSLRTQTY